MDKLISVVIPMHQEEEVISHTYKRLSDVFKTLPYSYELIFVDDGSFDNTFDIIKNIALSDYNVKCIKLSRNFGQQVAVTAGILNATGDCVILIDADLQDPPEVIPLMIEKWEQGVKVCIGVRKKRFGETKFKLITAKVYYRLLQSLSDISIPVDAGDFRLMDRQVVEEFKKMPEKNRFIRGMVSYVGFKQEPVYYVRDERFLGKTKYNFKKLFKHAKDGIFSFSSKPLKFIYYLSLIPLVSSLLFFISFIGNNLLLFFFISLFSFFFFLTILCIGILGDYILRIYDETKQRPLYSIEQLINL